jgi:hypothetical protein
MHKFSLREVGSKLKKSIVFLFFSLCLIYISITSYAWAGDVQLAPDGTYVGGEPQSAPDGTYIGSEPQLAPDGTYVGVESDW